MSALTESLTSNKGLYFIEHSLSIVIYILFMFIIYINIYIVYSTCRSDLSTCPALWQTNNVLIGSLHDIIRADWTIFFWSSKA